MIVKVANKYIKHPVEIFVPDEQWDKIKDISNKDELNNILAKLAMAHIAKHGYELGYCEKTAKRVTLRDCMNCGVSKGWGSGVENYAKWEQCKKESIHYNFGQERALIGKIDEKLAAKLQPQTRTEQIQESQTFSVVEKPDPKDPFQKNSDDVMKQIRKVEDNK
jgi:hypothetical protein